MHIPLLTDIVVLLGVSLLVLYLSHHIEVPSVVAFLATGVLLGPHGLGAVQAVEDVEVLAEIGVILVLFAVGLEFSLRQVLRMGRAVVLGGTLQVFGVLALVFLALQAAGMSRREALFLGMIASLSSTAVVLRVLQQRAEVHGPHGRMSLAVLIYQDLMIVPMMLLVPVLAGAEESFGAALAAFGVKALGIIALVLVLARWVVPHVLERVVGTRDRDMFLLMVVGICLAVAWAAAAAGLSLALGAFLAGLIVSESEYSHQALADILPFRDLFASFFFISIGMLLDVRMAAESPLLLSLLVLGVVFLKAGIATLAALALGLALRTAVLVGLALSQVGEFSFILASSGLREGVIDPTAYQWFVVTAVVSIGITPFLMAAAPRLAAAVGALPFPARLKAGGVVISDEPEDRPALSDHVVVVGFGLNGGNVARAAQVAGIPFIAIEMNPEIVREQRGRGVPIFYGDATQAPVLEMAGVPRARAVVLAISNAAATRRITALARQLNPACRIISRTRYLREVEPLQEAGADVVIPEELETSLEIVARVLASYMVPKREIDAFLQEVRAGGYGMLRSPSRTGPNLADLQQRLAEIEISTLRVDADSPLEGQRLGETDLRRLFGITVVAIRRGEDLLPNPGADALLERDDALIVMGLNEEISAASELFRAPVAAEEEQQS